MSHTKKVTLREFKHDSRYQRMAHDGHPLLVTYRGKPYFVAAPPQKAGTFLGAARAGAPLKMNVLLDTATWINAVREPETLPTRALNILRDETNSFFLSGGPIDGMVMRRSDTYRMAFDSLILNLIADQNDPLHL
jgi:hypothetical protein